MPRRLRLQATTALELSVHMNGRIYDPLLGRFLSADLVVQAPGSLQSYNRYSYVMNNPLTLVDPSGFIFGTPLSLREYTGAVARGLGEGAFNIGKAVVTAPVRVVDTFVQGGKNIGQVIVDVKDAGGLQNYMAPINNDPLTAAALPQLVGIQMVADAGKGIYQVATSGDSQQIANASVDLGLAILSGKLASPAVAAAEVTTQEASTLARTGTADARAVTTAPEAASPKLDPTTAPAAEAKNAPIPKPAKGPGSVPPELRDPKRVFTRKTVDTQLQKKGGTCEQCNDPLKLEDAKGHHIERHADGGKTTTDNLAVVCDDCHKELHR